jgi:DNA sulfur modification protein DndD
VLLRQVVLHNFAGYRGRQVVDLAPPAPDRPVVLFGGLNGAGKTTLLDALQLVLYGKRARCAGRGNLSYDEYLRRSINRSVSDREGAAVELAFEATFDGQASSFRVHRSWERTGSGGVREQVDVTRDEIAAPLLTERWDEVVEELLPLEISSLFFFDGEKIEALADPERAGRVMSTAIESLLGLNLLDRLGVDLIALERRKRAVAADQATRDELNLLEQQVAEARAERARAAQEQAARQNEVDRAEAARRRAERAFWREGGELYDRRTEVEESRRTAIERLTRIDERLRDLASGALPLRLVGNLVGQVVDQMRLEKDAQRAEVLGDALLDRDRRLLKHVRAQAGREVTAEIQKFLDADRAERAEAAELPRYLHPTEELEQRLSFVWPNELHRAASEVRDLLQQREVAQADIDECDRQLAAVPSADAIAATIRRRDECETAVAEAKVRLAVAAEVVATADRAIDEAEGRLQRAYRDATAMVAAEEDARRIVDHATRVRSTLDAFRAALLERHLNRIEAAVLDSLKKLLRKQRLVADLRLDPVTFELGLFDEEGRSVPTERLSAGERQLLAVAMLWGLARVSGRQLPMVIDTPLGRLDSTHRRLIVERYFPHASHQVVLLSTDEEIDEELLGALEPAIGRSYELQHNDHEGWTRVVEGYFWKARTDVA